jgi:hypothetical protein
MKQFGSISTLEAFRDLSVARLASRIHDLRSMGYNIESEIKSSKNRFGEKTYFKEYRLAEEKEN